MSSRLDALLSACTQEGSLQCLRLLPLGESLGEGEGSLLLGEGSGICGRVWDSALVLARWAVSHASALQGALAVELGSGTVREEPFIRLPISPRPSTTPQLPPSLW